MVFEKLLKKKALLVVCLQDKFAQKQHFAANGVPLPEFREIKCRGCMEATGRNFGFPFMLKVKRWEA
jgi:phosphoribosylaminoimidazole carboxylase